MSYSIDLAYPIENVSAFVRAIGDDAFYSAGLSAFSTTECDILLGQTDGCFRAGSNGVNFFSWGSLYSHSEGYEEALSASVYRNKSVQTYSLNHMLKAGADELIGKLERVYGVLAPENAALMTRLNRCWQRSPSVRIRSRRMRHLPSGSPIVKSNWKRLTSC